MVSENRIPAKRQQALGVALASMWAIAAMAKAIWPDPSGLGRALAKFPILRGIPPATFGYGVISIEAIVALFLVSRPHERTSYLASFFVASALLLGSAWIGPITSCACFGRLQAPLGVRVGVLMALLVGSYIGMRIATPRDDPDARLSSGPADR